MKIFALLVLFQASIHGLSPSKTVGKLGTLSRATQKVRKFVKGVADFVSSKKPSSTKAKKNNSSSKSRKTAVNRPRKSTRPAKRTKSLQKAETKDSTDSSLKNFAAQMAIAGVSGGGLTLLQGKDDSGTDYEYEYVTETTPSTISLSTVSSFILRFS